MFIFRHQQTPKQSKVQTIRLYICILQYFIHVIYSISRVYSFQTHDSDSPILFYTASTLLYSTVCCMPLLCILTTNAHYTRTTATEANNAGTRLFSSSPRLDLDWVFHFLPLIPLFILHSLHRLIPLLPHYLPEGKQDPLIHFHPLSTQLLLHSDLTRSSSSGVNLKRSPSETVLVQVSQVSARCHSVFSFSFLGRVCVCVSVVIFFFSLFHPSHPHYYHCHLPTRSFPITRARCVHTYSSLHPSSA